MKTKLQSSVLTALNLAVALFALAATPLQAANYTWDAVTGNGNQIDEGGGTWNAAGYWYNGTTYNQNWADLNTAVFGNSTAGTGNPGTVSLSGPVSCTGITFNTPRTGSTGNYTIDTGANVLSVNGTLTFNANATIQGSGGVTYITGTAPSVTIANGITATISANFNTGSATSWNFGGAGTAYLSGSSPLVANLIVFGGGKVQCTTIGNGGSTCSIAAGSSFTLGRLALNGTLEYVGSGSGGVSMNRTVTLNSAGNSTTTGGGIILNNASPAGSLTLSATTLLNKQATAAARPLTFGGASDIIVSGVISDNSGVGALVNLTKQDAGTLTLNGADTYTGSTTVSGGTLKAGNASALGFGGNQTAGTTTTGTTVSSGATLDLNGQTINEPITISGTGVGGNGALINSGSAATIPSGIAGIAVSAGGSAYSSAPSITSITGGGSSAAATATLGLTAATFTSTTFTGGAGTWAVGDLINITGGNGNGAIGYVSAVGGSPVVPTAINFTGAGANPGYGFTAAPTGWTKNTSTSGTVTGGAFGGTAPNATSFQVSAVSMTTAGSGYTGTPTFSIGGNATPSTVTLSSVALAADSSIGGSGNITINAVVSGSTFALTKVGAGTLTLGGANTYSGNTTISGGTLKLDTGGSLASTPVITVATGAGLDVSASTLTTALTLGSSQTLKASATGANTTGTITVGSGKNLTLGNATTGLEFTAYGGGSTAPLTLAGSAGNLNLNGEPIKVDVTGSALNAGPYTLIANGGSATVSGSPGSLDLSGGLGVGSGATGVLYVNSTGLILSTYYSVTFDAQGGSVSPSTINATNGFNYGTLPTPSRSGFAFNGWFTAASGGTQVNAGSTVSLTAPQTLYAQWTASATPTKLVITSVPSGTTAAGNTFSVTVQAQDNSGNPGNVTSATGISLATTGSGTLAGNTATIPNGQNSVTLTGVTYTKAEAITLTASQSSGTPTLSTSAASSSFTVVPNVASAANSTVVASPASLAADNSSLSTVTATLQDAYGNLLAGSNVTWSTTGTGNTLSPASSGTTSGSGVVSFTVKSAKAETKTVTVQVGSTVVTNSLQITFTAPGTGNSFTWDPSHNGSGSDAAGTWDTSTANWANGSADFAWPNNGNDNATFGSGAALGANYAITMGAPVTVGNLTFNTTGANQYTLGNQQPITLTANSTVSVAGAAKISSPLVGNGSLTKIGSGTLTFGQTSNSFTGGITIKNGTFTAGNKANNLGTGPVTLGVAASDPAAGPATLSFDWNTYTNPITLGASAVAPLTLTDVGNANPQVQGGINLNGNNLNILKSGGNGANSALNISTTDITGAGSLTLSNVNVAGNGTITISAPVNITGAITNVGVGTNATAISGNIGSTVTAVVQNSATAGLTLSGSNTFSSGLYINSGTVTAGANTNALGGASGNGDGSVYLGDTGGSANATLLGSFITGTAPYPNPITIQSGSSGTLTIGVSGATTSTKFTGAITQNKAFSLLSGSTSGNLNLSGQITGNSQITTDGSGTSYVTLTADNHSSWTGPLVVNSGTFKPGSANCLGSGNTVQINPGATFDLQNASVTIAGLNDNGSSGGTVVNAGSGATLSTLTFGGSGSYSFAGTIAPATTSKIALTMAGSGTQMLGGINTYSGATTISSGTLALGSGGSIANTPNISIAAGATFDVSAAGITLSGSSPQQTLAGGSTNGTATINAPSQTVTLSSSVLLSFKAGGGVSSTVGKISVAGSSANLTLNNSAVTVNVTGSALAAGTYRLLDCAGTLTGTANSTPTITGTALASGYSATVSTTPGAGGHVDLIVNATPSFSGLTASPSIAYGATSVALSGTVSSATGPTTVYAASGDTVTATIHGHAVSGTVSGSAGAFTITYNDASLATLGVGSSPYTITYSYAGNAAVNLNAAANNTGTSLMVGKATPTATLAVNNSPATYNGSAQSATVVINSSSVPGTVGNVKYDGSATAPVAAGTYTVTADFIPNDAADYNTLTGLSAGNFAINPAATTITLSGTTFTYNGSVQSPSISISGSTGARSTNYIGTSYSGANAPTNAGSYTLIVSVLGDGNFFGATNSLPFTINQASISVGASSTNNPCGYHDAVAFLATLPADATGSVVFSSTNGPISTNNVSSGTVTSLSITNLPRGTNVITVAYLGDGNYLGSSTNLEQIVTNHPPIAGMMTVTRTAGLALIIKLSDIATNWSDADGDSVKLTDVTMQSTNGINLFPLNWSTNLDGSIVTTNGYAYIGYTNSPNVADQISYSISDGQDGTNLGYISIVIQGSVTGTNSITGHDFSSPYSNTVTAYGIPYFYYTLERSTNLTSPVWVDVSTNQAAGNGVINAVDTFWDLGGVKPSPSAFYQLKWQP